MVHEGEADSHHSGTTQNQNRREHASGEHDSASDATDDDGGLSLGHGAVWLT